MTDTQLQRMAQAAAVIRRVVGHDFRCHVPATWDPQPATRIQQQMQDLARETALLISGPPCSSESVEKHIF